MPDESREHIEGCECYPVCAQARYFKQRYIKRLRIKQSPIEEECLGSIFLCKQGSDRTEHTPICAHNHNASDTDTRHKFSEHAHKLTKRQQEACGLHINRLTDMDTIPKKKTKSMTWTGRQTSMTQAMTWMGGMDNRWHNRWDGHCQIWTQLASVQAQWLREMVIRNNVNSHGFC